MMTKIYFAMLLARFGGWKLVWEQIMRRVYYKDIYIALERDLEQASEPLICHVNYSLEPASAEDFRQISSKVKQESHVSAIDLIQRLSLFDAGFRRCFVAKNSQTGDICSFQWLILPNDEAYKNNHKLNSVQPQLQGDEAIVEGAYTFEKYRGNGINCSITDKLCNLAKELGCTRARVYINAGNQSSFATIKKVGFKRFEEITEYKFLFILKRTYKIIQPDAI